MSKSSDEVRLPEQTNAQSIAGSATVAAGSGVAAVREMRSPPSSTNIPGLRDFDFDALRNEKANDHLKGTREWVFKALDRWRANPDGSQMFWLMGSGGTGKSVVAATWLRRLAERREGAVAWHFCRHDDPSKSEPTALLRSLAAMLCRSVTGFEGALRAQEGLDVALTSVKTDEVFRTLLAEPLTKVGASETPRVVLIDALDEIPRNRLGPLLEVITTELRQLPVRLFVTSRDEAKIRTKFKAFEPTELRVDEARNQQDVHAYITHIAREYVHSEVTAEDIECEIKEKFKIDMEGAMKILEEPMVQSKHHYDIVVGELQHEEEWSELLKISSRIDGDLKQMLLTSSSSVEPRALEGPSPSTVPRESDEYLWPVDDELALGRLYACAERAVARMKTLLAPESSWEPMYKGCDWPQKLRTGATKAEWLDGVILPALKGEKRAREKTCKEYGGDIAQLKDLARLTLCYHSVSRMVSGITCLGEQQGFKVVQTKNKYADPTPMGYRDVGLCVRVEIEEGLSHLCEVQFNLTSMLTAKSAAHVCYEEVRSRLPAICLEHGGTDMADALECYIAQRLNNSALDYVVNVMAARADGLFIYARLLAEHLEATVSDGARLDVVAAVADLPTGLDNLYKSNFERVFPQGEGWEKCRALISAVVAGREPLPLELLKDALAWDDAQAAEDLSLVSLLFPERGGRLRVLHKSVVDWLVDETRSATFFVASRLVVEAHAALGQASLGLLKDVSKDTRWGGARLLHPGETCGPEAAYLIAHGARHLAEAGRLDEAVRTLGDFAWLKARLDAGQFADVVRDLALVAVESVRGEALRPSAGLVGASAAARELQRFLLRWRHVLTRPKNHEMMLEQIAANEPDALALAQRATATLDANHRSPYIRVVPAWKEASLHPCLASLHPCLQTLEGHTGSVKCAAVSPDGTFLVTGGHDGTIKIWDRDTGECTQTLTGHTSWVGGVAISGNGRWLASGSQDKTVKIWDTESGEIKKDLKGHTYEVNGVAISGDGRWLASAGGKYNGSNPELKIWDVESGECKKDLKGHSKTVKGVAISGDGRWLASAGGSMFGPGEVKIWDVESGECKKDLKGHSKKVNGVAISGNGRWLASAGGSMFEPGEVKIWDAETGECKKDLKGHTDQVNGVAISGDGKWLASASDDNTVKIWVVESGETKKTLEGHSSSVNGVAISGDGRWLASASNVVKIWDVESGEMKNVLEGHSESVWDVAISGDGRWLASASGDHTVKIWDAENGKCKKTLEGYNVSSSVGISGDGRWLAAACSDNTVKIWDVGSGEMKKVLEGHSEHVCDVAISGDGRWLASGGGAFMGRNSELKIWDVESGECKKDLKGHSTMVKGVAISGDGRWLASASYDSTVKIWDTQSGETKKTLKGHKRWVHGVAISGDGRWLASAGFDETIKIWDAESGETKKTLKGHTSGVDRVAISGDGRWLVSTSKKETIVWEASTGKELARHPALNLEFTSLALHNNRLAIGTSAGTLCLADVVNAP